MSVGAVEVAGGEGGTAARLEDLDAAAAALAGEAWRLLEAFAVLWGAGAALDLSLTAPLSPRTALEAVAAVARASGPTGFPASAAGLSALAGAVAGVAAAYRTADAAVAALVGAGQDALGRVLAPGVLAGAAATVTAWLVADQLVGRPPLRGLAGRSASALDVAAFEHPGVVETVAGGVDGALTGLGEVGPGTPALSALASTATGRPFPPRDEAAAVALLRAALLWGSGGALLADGSAVQVRPAAPDRPGTAAPTSLAELLDLEAQLSSAQAGPGLVRVVEVPRADGTSSWLVVLPGTQDWSPTAGSNPADLTTDVLLLAQQPTQLAAGASAALDQAMAASGRDASGDPVLLAGHSQGGIAAAALAASPAFRHGHHVTHVVATGSPIARLPIPSEVTVLALEHRQDPVTRLDGAPNPDRRSWVTVTRDLRADPTVPPRGSAAHSLTAYHRSALLADRDPSPSMTAWRADSAAFFAGDTHGSPVVRDYRLTRVVAPP